MSSPNKFATAMLLEAMVARRKHPPLNSAHEGYAVILEELDEFWDEVRKKQADRNPVRMRDELVQIAAMAMRTAEDVIDPLIKKS